MEQGRSIGINNRKAESDLYTLPGRLLQGLLYSSVFISCCAFSLTVETYLLADVPVSLPVAVFVFLATLFTYNLSSVQSILRYPGQTNYRQHAAWGQRNKGFLAGLGLAGIAAAAVIYISFDLRLNFWFMLHLALISVGYTVPTIYKQRKVRPLRSVPLLKVFLIAYVWAAVTVLFPLMDAGMPIWDAPVLWLFLRRFLFILALALLFDIRDYTYDRHTNTLTFPGWMGVRNTKLFSLGLLLLYIVLLLNTENGIMLWALISSAVGAATVVLLSSAAKPRIYYALLADGAMLLHAGLVYLAKA
jgi:4-hydroxybenzoate polyprenyltransferase